MAKIKIIDVAQHAGVSKSTISQYLNGRFDYMSKKTKARVEASISELNYIPNAIARSLKTNTTKTIGVIVRDVSGYYTSKTLRGIDDFCKSSEYNVIIYNTDFDQSTEVRSLQSLKQLGVDGIIIASSGMNNGLIDEFNDNVCPIIQFQLEYDDCNTSIVVSEYEKASFEATEYLLKLGHKRICFLTQNFQNVKSRHDRYQGFIKAHEKHNIPVNPELIQYWDREQGFHHSIESILALPSAPSAFFSQHLAITKDFLLAVNQLNITMPYDVSFIGFDDLPMAEFFKVPVTTIKQDTYKVGAEAAKLLLANIKNKTNDVQKVTIPCKFEKRMSCHIFEEN
jgi:DNA-binding LacI/PurR family transcriptional regulator